MPSRLQIVFWLDVILLISVCALEQVPFTGMIVHEWLGLALIGLIVAHLLMSWTWIASTTRRLIAPSSNRARVNYFLNLCLFASITAVIFSGILISQHAVPVLAAKDGFRWAPLHDRISNFVVFLAGLHLAINWDWSVAAVRKIWLGYWRVSR